MVEFKESKFYKLLQDFFINNDKETFIQFLAEFYNKTEGIIIKNELQDEIIKELREMFLLFNEEGIDENIVREKVNYFLENNEKIQDIIRKLTTNINKVSKIEDNIGITVPREIKIGDKALENSSETNSAIAIGRGAMKNTPNSRYNIAIGLESQYSLNCDNNSKKGTRNVSVGDNSMRFNETGYGNIAIGRNSLQANNGDLNVSVGTGAMSGNCPLNLKGEIVNQDSTTCNENVAVGTDSLYSINSNYNTSVGSRSSKFLKKGGYNTTHGYMSLCYAESDIDNQARKIVAIDKEGTYEWKKNNIKFVCPEHGIEAGNAVLLQFTTGEANVITSGDKLLFENITVLDNNTFTISIDIEKECQGSIRVNERRKTEKETVFAECNVAIGAEALKNPIRPRNTTAIGFRSAMNLNGESNVAVGMFSMIEKKQGNKNTALGYRAMSYNSDLGDENTCVGNLSGSHITGNKNTSIGASALRYMIDGTYATNLTNACGIGYDARVSGNNQVQIGDRDVDVYTHKAIQNRSDARDKIDIEDTKLGLEFINSLRPVDFRYNFRESYIDIDEGKAKIIPNNGSRSGERKHHGLIAQEVKSVMDRLGIDFGGYQDHKINGGIDVLSIGYTELIAPIIKAIQELSDKIAKIESNEC